MNRTEDPRLALRLEALGVSLPLPDLVTCQKCHGAAGLPDYEFRVIHAQWRVACGCGAQTQWWSLARYAGERWNYVNRPEGIACTGY